ncbi:MAG: DMT family transporter, partial [Eubacterium sp.]
SATVAGFLMGLAVIFTPFMSCIILKETFKKRTLGFVALVVAGMYLLCGSQAGFRFGLGEVLALLSSLAFAGALIYSGKHVVGIGPQALVTVQTGVATLVCLILALIFEDYHTLTQTTLTSWLCVLYLAIGCTVIAYLLQNTALKHLSPIFVSLALSSEPIFTALFSYGVLGERLTITGALGAGLIMASIVLASLFNSE